MGGLALKSVVTRRCSREEFDIMNSELTEILGKTFKRVGIPMFYKNKKSFGDIDIIISMEGFNGNMRDYITETFKPNEIFHNGNCWSFDYNSVQIDFITTSDEHYESYLFYMGGNDLGNFIGRIAQGFGLKYGQEGLWYEHYYKSMNIARIPISKDYRDIFKFLGLSYERWEAGFDELEDIFEYIATCKFFNWKLFQLAKLNKINRERNLKRKSYMSFLEWIEANVADAAHEYDFDVNTQEEYNKMIAEAFPYSDLELNIRKAEYEYCKGLYIKAKFNGGEVMRKYCLQGKELGDAMNGFKQFVNDGIFGDYEECMLQQNKETIYKLFDSYINWKKLKQTV